MLSVGLHGRLGVGVQPWGCPGTRGEPAATAELWSASEMIGFDVGARRFGRSWRTSPRRGPETPNHLAVSASEGTSHAGVRQRSTCDSAAQCFGSAHRCGVGRRGAVGADGLWGPPHTHGSELSVPQVSQHGATQESGDRLSFATRGESSAQERQGVASTTNDEPGGNDDCFSRSSSGAAAALLVRRAFCPVMSMAFRAGSSAACS